MKAVFAEIAKRLSGEINEQVMKEPERSYRDDPEESRFSGAMMNIFRQAHLNTIGPAELEQFRYDVHVQQEGSNLVFRTDESEVSGFL